ncbi:MAG: sigma 54-interacting transcriptional regulator [Planctomycetota bacterium]|nr:sigma 54-interacting transcriptional regulator [Planctomycetota bacterium]
MRRDSAARFSHPAWPPRALGLAALLLSLLASAGSAAAEPGEPPRELRLSAHAFGEAPRVDGNLEDWKAVGEQATARLGRAAQVHPARRDAWEGEADASAEVLVGVHGDALYLAARVTDDLPHHDPADSWWHWDSVEVFLNTRYEEGVAPPETFGDGCWQLFLMPLNPEVAWGVVFRGPETYFDDGGLAGIDIAHRTRPGGYDFEARIPLAELGITSREARGLGFALALNDSDEDASTPGTYLSWNEGQELYRFPNRFGVLDLPARQATPANDRPASGAWPLFTLIAALLVLVAAALLAGPGARWLARRGPKPKLIGLGLVVLLAAGLHIEQTLSERAARDEVSATLEALAETAEAIAADARAAGALQEADEAARTASLRQLLGNESIPCVPGVEAAAFVPLHEGGTYRDDRSVVYRIPLDATLDLALPERPRTRRVTLDIERERVERTLFASRQLGVLRLVAVDGTETEVPLTWPDGAGTSTQQSIDVELSEARDWARLRFTPAPRVGALTLRGVAAYADGNGGTRRPLALPGRTEEGVPVLAHPRGPDHGIRVEPGATASLPLPDLLGGSDRLWLLLRAERAFPDLLGDDVLARVHVDYEVGESADTRELRNGEHLSAERQPLGLERPIPRKSRVAFRWSDTLGYGLTREAIPLPLDTARRPTGFRIENTGKGGALRVVAATVVRTRRLQEDSLVHLVMDEREPADRIHLAQHGNRLKPYLDPAGRGAIALERDIGEGRGAALLRLQAPLPADVEAKRARTTVALLTCLALGLFMIVLLAVDAADRLPYLSRRLSFGVLAAALVPLGITIFLVDRTNTERVTVAYTDRATSGVAEVETRLAQTLKQTSRAARRLALHLSRSPGARDPAEVRRIVPLLGGSVLPPGSTGSAIVSSTETSPLHVPLGGAKRRLKGTRYLPTTSESGGFHVSPWDGLVAMASARRGAGDRRVDVTLGVSATDALLERALGGGLEEAGASAALLDASGRVLAHAGAGGADLGRALGAEAGTVGRRLEAGGTYVVPDLAGTGSHHLAAVTALPRAGQARGGDGWLVLGFDRADLEADVADQREPLIWLALFGLVIVVSVASLMARRVAAPVRELVTVTDAVRRGTFDVAVEPTSEDEIGELTVAFDQMRRDLKNRVGDLDFLRRAQDTLSASLDVGETAERALDLFLEQGPADEAIVLGAQGYGTSVNVLAARGAAARFGDRPFEPSAGGWIEAALKGTQVRLVHHEADAQMLANERGAARRLTEDLGAWLAVPLTSGRELQGLLVLGWKSPDDVPQKRGQRLLVPLAGIVAAALNNARLYRLAALDDVTRLPGATAFEAALRDDVEQALAGGEQSVLLRVGLDHLEHVTLRRGVEASRTLLRACAEAMRGILGDRARLGRLRGEELAVRLTGAGIEDARRVAEAVRERIASVEVSPEEGGEPLITTVSIGIARAPEDAGSVEFLLDAAGRALSAAKREGGDRVEDVARVDAGAVEMPPYEEGAIFRNERMVRVVEAARRAARSDASVLITGETGTGKEVIATLVHRRSARAERPFVTVNCAAFPETLLESELFGHERGAFTGADRRREGRFELADGGTLFLDEIAEMTPSAQVKLLRVLQERQFARLGGTRTITVDVRIIAATNRDLEKAVAEGIFREDLYYRLNVIRLDLPPLRDRREEIPFLVEKFLTDFRRRAGRGPRALTPAAMDVLYRHPWPGNVRELKNAVERCAVLCEADVVGPEHLQFDAMHAPEASSLTPRSAPQDQLNARQRALLEYLARNGRATNRTYYEMTGTSPRTALRDLQDLMNRGLIVREGKRRGAVYRLA